MLLPPPKPDWEQAAARKVATWGWHSADTGCSRSLCVHGAAGRSNDALFGPSSRCSAPGVLLQAALPDAAAQPAGTAPTTRLHATLLPAAGCSTPARHKQPQTCFSPRGPLVVGPQYEPLHVGGRLGGRQLGAEARPQAVQRLAVPKAGQLRRTEGQGGRARLEMQQAARAACRVTTMATVERSFNIVPSSSGRSSHNRPSFNPPLCCSPATPAAAAHLGGCHQRHGGAHRVRHGAGGQEALQFWVQEKRRSPCMGGRWCPGFTNTSGLRSHQACVCRPLGGSTGGPAQQLCKSSRPGCAQGAAPAQSAP